VVTMAVAPATEESGQHGLGWTLEADLYIFERSPARLGHENGENHNANHGQDTKQEVRTKCGCVEEDRGDEGDEPIGKLPPPRVSFFLLVQDRLELTVKVHIRS
jgi:hypothetical protein